MLQFNGGELALQIRQAARPAEFEPAPRRARRLGRTGLRQEFDESLHLLLRRSRQSFIFGDQCVFAHNSFNLPTTGCGCNLTNAGSSAICVYPNSFVRFALFAAKNCFHFPAPFVSVAGATITSAPRSRNCATSSCGARWSVTIVSTMSSPHNGETDCRPNFV